MVEIAEEVNQICQGRLGTDETYSNERRLVRGLRTGRKAE
jgi:hypothetical protein